MNNHNISLKRFFSLLIVLIMVIGMLPASVFAAGTTLYLKPNSNWVQSNAWFAMYYWNNSGSHWAKMTDDNKDGLYEAQLPAEYTNVIFCRMNPASTTLDWNNKWDQTIDLTFNGSKNLFTVANGAWNNASGTWSVHEGADTPQETTQAAELEYYLVGYINNADYNGENYHFVDNKLTVTFDNDSYVVVKDSTGDWYLTQTYCTDTTGTFSKGNSEKMFVPGGKELTFTLSENTDGSLTMSYTADQGGGNTGDEGDGGTCNVTLHFADTLGWGKASLYSWAGASDVLLGGWPGLSLSKDADGFYSHTYEVPSGQTINFIFNNGSGSQTVDLTLGAVTTDVEKWVRISGETDGKYTAEILNKSFVVVQSPIVDGNTVTFYYEGGSSVQVYGSWDQWAAPTNMTKDANGIWTAKLTDLQPGTYEYKFVADGTWVTDPVNGWTQNDNSAFIILNPDAVDKNEITLNIHYTRSDKAYEGWNMYLYNGAGSLKAQSETLTENGLITTLVLEGRAVQYVNVIPRLSTKDNQWASQEATQTVDLSNVLSGTVDYYITAGSSANVRVLNADVVTGHKLSDVQLDYDSNMITVTLAQSVSGATFNIVNTENENDDISAAKISGSGTTYTLEPSKTLDLDKLYQYKVEFEGYYYDIQIDSVYASDKFGAEYTYTGNDLGASWTSDATTFRVWAPTATEVKVNLYTSGTKDTDDLIRAIPMNRDVNGTWIATVEGDLNGTYYTYAVHVDGQVNEAVDPYARTTGVNGHRGMVIDLDSTDPEGWENDTNPNPSTNYTDAVIYELHVRDFSIDDSSGIMEDYQGKFLAFTQEGSTVPGTGIATGIDYLKQLGVTHLHLLPVYDYESVDETTCSNFNWGYDPQNYNVPEGSYSTDPYKGEVRVAEFKQMVQALHEAGISVIMDVVYNHVYDAGTFCFNNIVPGYFSRVDSNGSGCGNDTASEREMVHKYIVESILYWTEEYHIDGFRFDLVGLIDTNTINTLVDKVHETRPDVIFYGEGWTLGTNSEPGYAMSTQQNAAQTPDFAYFSDVIRNLLAGDNSGNSLGYVSGATGQESSIIANFKATPWYSADPSQIVQYASCHDNYTLADKLILSTKSIGLTDDVIAMNNLTAAIYMASQGIPFIHAGEELLREKINTDGSRNHNSYNSSDYVNAIRWNYLTIPEYADTSAYYQGLIAFRKAHPALRMTNAADISKYIQTAVPQSNVTAFFIDGAGTGDEDIFVVFNPNKTPVSVNLPSGIWNVCVDGQESGTETLYTAQVSVLVEGVSAIYLTRKDEGENEAYSAGGAIADAVTVYFTDSQNWGNVYAYTWTPELASWPGMQMTWEETNDYGQNVYSIQVSAGAAGLVFSNGNGTQTVDLTVPADGMGYYPEANTDGKWTCGSYKYRDPASSEPAPDDTPAVDYVGQSQYFLFGWINGQNYGCEETANSMGKYQFVNGKLNVMFKQDSYVGVKTTANKAWYMTDGWLGNVKSATLYSTDGLGTSADKLMIPGGVPVTLTLTEIDQNSVQLSYEITKPETVTDTTGIQDGMTLHCWNWSFSEIQANMEAIADMGFTAIQTSPVQPIKETTVNSTVGGSWWVYYQPVDFVIADQDGNALGTKAQLQSMIETAHSYGIRVIVDVVANHLGNQTGNNLSNQIPEHLTAPTYWHNISVNISDYTSRYQVTQQCMGGLPDLNTQNLKLQEMVVNFLIECMDLGVDGFRFDAAKHIETPEDQLPYRSNFWPNIIENAERYAKLKLGKDVYMYGEVLDSQTGISVSAYTKYMAITDNSWGNTLRENIGNGNAAMTPGYDKPADATSLVIWAESHDTYATDQAALSSANESQAVINRTWALVAARKDAMGLYFARPETNSQLLGVASVTGWANPEVKAVNLFHKAFLGQEEYISNNEDISYVERGNGGVVLVNVKGNGGQISVPAKAMADGVYVDQLTGNTFTVENGIISGVMGDTGIAVVYEPPKTYTVTVTPTTHGQISVSETNPTAGTKVIITITPNEDKVVDTVTVTDAEGNPVEQLSKRSIKYSFIQPESHVTVTVTFKDAPVPGGPTGTGEGNTAYILMAVMLLSAIMLAILVYKRKVFYR